MRYSVDREDRITVVSDAWLEFARMNGARQLTREAVVGKSLWDFITGIETRHLYGLVFCRVREAGLSVVLPFRCDAPSVRRFMALAIRPAGQGGIDLTGRLIRSEARESVCLLEPAVVRAETFLTICSWCKQVLLANEQWAEVEEAIVAMDLFAAPRLPQLTHGICPVCVARVHQEIDPNGVWANMLEERRQMYSGRISVAQRGSA